jgi:hypothetical protein
MRSILTSIKPGSNFFALLAAVSLLTTSVGIFSHANMAQAAPLDLERITQFVDTEGIPSGGEAGGSLEMTPDGRYIVYSSTAINLVANDTNFREDIFVHDSQTNATERVSVDSKIGRA